MRTHAIIIPTLNEAGNVSVLVERLEKVLAGVNWEAIFVDDGSHDGTVKELLALAADNPRVRFIRRLGRKGLASACVEGMMSTAATYMAVMDADLQHDESKLPEMFHALSSGEATLAVGSRYTGEGSTGTWGKTRVGMSKFATTAAQQCLTVECSDPMSGFFALHRDIIDRVAEKLQSRGFKILFDILTFPELNLRIKEVPYTFRERTVGVTKLSYSVIVDFAWLLLTKCLSRLAYAQFAIFCIVGLLGVGVHLSVLFILHKALGFSFLFGQSAATLCAMTFNYFLNNIVTFGEQRLKGREWLFGYAKFVGACAVGAFANIASADYLQKHSVTIWLAACAGVVIGAFLNYFFAKFFIWNQAPAD